MSNLLKKRNKQRELRKGRVRSVISGTNEIPRLAVFRSNRFVELQLIDDAKGQTLMRVSSRGVSGDSKTAVALETGKLLGKQALEAGIKEAIFDRRHYKYHGRVKAVADGVREAGLKV